MLERVEAKRVEHLVAEFENLQRIDEMRTEDYVTATGWSAGCSDAATRTRSRSPSGCRRSSSAGAPSLSRDDLVALLDELAAGDIDVDDLRAHPEPAPERYRLRVAEPEDGGGPRPRAGPARPR